MLRQLMSAAKSFTSSGGARGTRRPATTRSRRPAAGRRGRGGMAGGLMGAVQGFMRGSGRRY
jgi:hypothetical protein